jgi:hypothetical protein
MEAASSLAFSLQLKPVTRMERLSAESCLAAGYDYRLYTYGDPQRYGVIPVPGEYADAREILPACECLPDPDGSYTTFRLRFMCAALFTHGGLWVDTDYVVTRTLPSAPFLAVRQASQLQPHALRLPAGSALALMADDLAAEALEAHYPPSTILETIQENWPARPDAKILSADEACPIGADQSDLVINPAPRIQPDLVYGYKLWRSRWEEADCTPDSRFSQSSLFEQLWARHFGMST